MRRFRLRGVEPLKMIGAGLMVVVLGALGTLWLGPGTSRTGPADVSLPPQSSAPSPLSLMTVVRLLCSDAFAMNDDLAMNTPE